MVREIAVRDFGPRESHGGPLKELKDFLFWGGTLCWRRTLSEEANCLLEANSMEFAGLPGPRAPGRPRVRVPKGPSSRGPSDK